MSAASIAPDIERHLKSDDEDPQVKILGPLSQRMLPLVLVQRPFVRVPVRWVVLVHNLALGLGDKKGVGSDSPLWE